jgi:hypothetical protein
MRWSNRSRTSYGDAHRPRRDEERVVGAADLDRVHGEAVEEAAAQPPDVHAAVRARRERDHLPAHPLAPEVRARERHERAASATATSSRAAALASTTVRRRERTG